LPRDVLAFYALTQPGDSLAGWPDASVHWVALYWDALNHQSVCQLFDHCRSPIWWLVFGQSRLSHAGIAYVTSRSHYRVAVAAHEAGKAAFVQSGLSRLHSSLFVRFVLALPRSCASFRRAVVLPHQPGKCRQVVAQALCAARMLVLVHPV
jgi:hypothetical protein